ncbi:MAG: ATP-binding protein [Nitrospira sp.]|nr:ATP-binding protein [Nitrospira sp.]
MRSHINPADGERRAMVGYVPQYAAAAELIYDSLLHGTFEWVKIADPEAGRVDDIQIASPGRIDAHQVKWGETIQNISFRDLTSDKKSKDSSPKPNLMKQLADGWQRLTSLYRDREIYVHLITCHVPSSTAKIPFDQPPPAETSLQGFLRDCWLDRSWTRNGFPGIPSGWHSAITEIQKATDLKDNELFIFLEHCDLHFQYRVSLNGTNTRSESRRNKDIEQLFKLIIEMAGGERRIIQLSCTELLRRLGWETRFKSYFKHEFWIDERLYHPITDTIAELEAGIDHFTKGYIALIGTPGSGKSTTLTQFLRYRKGVRVIRYYAFVRDDTQLGRGEAVNFLHDIVIALKEQGIRGIERSNPETREELLDQLSSQLSELGEHWKQDAVKTLILVDGLDHIEREQSPERSLLKDLPSPENFPDGVLFILGSQKVNLEGLSTRIKAHLQEQDRTLVMHALSRQSVFAITDAAPLESLLSEHQKDKILRLSDGHPLALIYLLQKLQHVENSQVDALLDSVDPYKGHIEQDYEVYWKSIETDVGTRELLALMSRLRGAICLSDVLSWSREETVRRMINTAGHYFRKETDVQWVFFHNSFRQFILMKTGRNLLDHEDLSKHKGYHLQLAEYASKAPFGSAWSWEELYHRACARDNHGVIDLGSQNNLRKQFYSLRPIEDILDDITLCLKAAREELDGLAVVRALLIESELRERNRNLEETDIPRLLLELKDTQAAVDYVIRGRELRVSATEALKFCSILITRGNVEAARIIFDVAEPLDILKGLESVEGGRTGNLTEAKAWANIAHYFRSLESIFQVVDQLRADLKSFHGWDPNDANGYVRHSVLKSLANGIFESRNPGKIEPFKKYLGERADAKDILLHMDFQACYERRNNLEADAALERILLWAAQNDLDESEKTLIAEYLFRIRSDKKAAAQWIETIAQPNLYKDEVGSEWRSLSPFLQRIRLNRLKAALGVPVDPVVAVPDSEDERQKAAVLFERMLVILANVWGRSWKGKQISPSEILSQIHPALVLFNRREHGTEDWTTWYRFKRAAPDYFSFLIKAVATHGTNAIEVLARAFESQWNNKETQHYWNKGWRRHIALELYRAGSSLESTLSHFSKIEEEMGIWDDIDERLRDCEEQALAWIEIGEPQRAQALLPRMLESAFGIYHDKDYRFQHWVEWLSRYNAEQRVGIADRVRRFSGALVVLENTSRGRYVQDGARDLIETTALWNQVYALSLCKWLLDNKSLLFENAVEGLLLAALKISAPPVEIILSVITHLLIPFQSGASAEFASLFAEKCLEVIGKEKTDELLRTLATTIDTKAYPTDRNEWWRGLSKGLRQGGTVSSWIEAKVGRSPKKDDGTTYPKVTLQSGETLRAEDILSIVDSYETFSGLLDSISAAEYFAWEKILPRIIGELNYDQLGIIKEKLEKFKLNQTALYFFARRLLELGYKEEARQIADEIMKLSSPRGWNPHYDGGSRLAAAQSLIDLEKEEGRRAAFRMFIDDYLAEIRYPTDLLWSLEKLIPIFFEKLSIGALWDEIEQHVYQIYDFSHAAEFPPAPPDAIEMHSSMLIELLQFTLAMPVPEIRQEALKAMCQIIDIRAADEAMVEILRELLTGGESEQICALSILEVVKDLRPDFINFLADECIQLSDSPNILVRLMAVGITEALHLQKKEIEKARIELPVT